MRRLVASVPDVRVVVSVREPVERAYSHYWARASRAVETRPFAEVVADEQADPDRRAAGRAAAHLLARGRYLDQIERALEVPAPQDQLQVVLFDDVELDPAETFAAHLPLHRRRPARWSRPRSAGRPTATAGTGPQRVRRMALRLPGRLADAVGHLNSRAADLPAHWIRPAPGADRALLRPDNEALARWLDRDLSAWSAGSPGPTESASSRRLGPRPG